MWPERAAITPAWKRLVAPTWAMYSAMCRRQVRTEIDSRREIASSFSPSAISRRIAIRVWSSCGSSLPRATTSSSGTASAHSCSNVATTQVGGIAGQTFTLTQRRGTSPYDLLCADGGSCYKVLDDKPMDVTAVRTSDGLVLFWVEYLPEDRAEVQGPMKTWLSSVRWQ